MGTLQFSNEIGRLQRALAQSPDMVARRNTVIESLRLRNGERVLEVGSGGGFCVYDAAQLVGATGRVCAVDTSIDQVAAAKDRCADLPWVECRVGDAVGLPYGDGEFDAVFGVQVFEYVPKLQDAFREVRRVLRRGGRFTVFDTNWSSLIWYSAVPTRMEGMLTAFRAHAYFQDLPAMLPGELRRAGFLPVRQAPVPVLNESYDADRYSYWLARIVRAFILGNHAAEAEDVAAWFGEFDDLQKQGAYFCCITPVLTEATLPLA